MANQQQLERLGRGVEEWNQWREKNFSVEIDFCQADLGKANLSRANLSGANLSETDLWGANLSEANLSEANLNKANFLETDLSKANLNKANLFETDLSKANLREANLRETNLFGANLFGANLFGANLFLVDLREANLFGSDLSGASLGGVNLGGANLFGANFFLADLSGSNLRETDLRGANLSRCSALGSDFSYATITGACIEDWHINSETNFENIICDYIYYQRDWQTQEYLDRRPRDENKIFNPGDFQRLIETARETVDLIFSDGIDWKAFLESFHGLQIESENGELAIAGILKKRDGTFVIQIDAPQSIDKATLENHFYEIYEQRLALIEQTYQTQLASKDQEITKRDQEILQLYREKSTDMTEIAKQLAANQQFINIEAKAMSYGNINQEGNFGVGVNLGKIKDNAKVAGTLNEAQQLNVV